MGCKCYFLLCTSCASSFCKRPPTPTERQPVRDGWHLTGVNACRVLFFQLNASKQRLVPHITVDGMTGVLLQKTTEVKPLNVKAMNTVAWCFSGTQSSLRSQKVAAGQKPSFSEWANFEVVSSMHHIRLPVNAKRTGIDSHANT